MIRGTFEVSEFNGKYYWKVEKDPHSNVSGGSYSTLYAAVLGMLYQLTLLLLETRVISNQGKDVIDVKESSTPGN